MQSYFPQHLPRTPPSLPDPGALTGVSSSGVEMGEQSPFSLMPLPRSKSQIFTGETWEGFSKGVR